MKVLRHLSWTRVLALFAVAAILSGALMSPAAMAQEEKGVENFPTVLQRDIILWSDGTRLSGVLLYPKDREEGEKLPAIVLCNGWGGTKAFLMRSGIAPRFAAAGYAVITGNVGQKGVKIVNNSVPSSNVIIANNQPADF